MPVSQVIGLDCTQWDAYSDESDHPFRRNPTTFFFAPLGTSDPGGAQASHGC